MLFSLYTYYIFALRLKQKTFYTKYLISDINIKKTYL